MTGSSFYTTRVCCASALLLALMTGCEKANSAGAKPAAPPVKVEIATPTEKEVTDFQDFTGRLEAVESVEIRARVVGYLTKIAFDPSIELGAEVKKGDPLFEIDERPYQIALQNAKAQLAQAEAGVPTNPGGTLTRSVSEGGRSTRRDSPFDVSWSARPR